MRTASAAYDDLVFDVLRACERLIKAASSGDAVAIEEARAEYERAKAARLGPGKNLLH